MQKGDEYNEIRETENGDSYIRCRGCDRYKWGGAFAILTGVLVAILSLVGIQIHVRMPELRVWVVIQSKTEQVLRKAYHI